jgi:AcrR family transcriptional regulator
VSTNEAEGRQCILEQAQRLFFAHGYHGASVRDIVQACGLSNAALYYHFGSKQNLFVQVFKAYVARATRQLEQAGAIQGSCRQRLAEMAGAYARFILESKSELHMVHRDLMQSGDKEMHALFPDALKHIPSLFATVLEEGIAAGEIRAVDVHRVSLLLVGMINFLAMRYMFGHAAGSLSEDIDLAITILFEGIDV